MTTWVSKLGVPVASAAILAGCAQDVRDDQTGNRAAMDNATNRQNLEVSFTGCVASGTGNDRFMLYDARPAALGEQPTDAMSAAHPKLPENVPVGLAMTNDDEIEKRLGHMVSVTGRLNDGRNTIGTTGEPTAPDQAGSRVDESQAATSQHHSEKVREEAGPIGNRAMNNGTFPELTVSRINSTGERCVANAERRQAVSNVQLRTFSRQPHSGWRVADGRESAGRFSMSPEACGAPARARAACGGRSAESGDPRFPMFL